MHWAGLLLAFICCWPLAATAQEDAALPVQLTSGIAAGYPDWAPDGQSIVFATFGTETEEGNLYVVSADGGEPWQLGFGGTHHGVFSPDGKYVAVDALNGTVVQVIPATGGTPVRVVPETVPIEMSANPCWSPDGRVLAFRTGNQICLLDLPSGKITTAFTSAAYLPVPVAWLPAGDALIAGFVVPGSMERNLWRVPLDGGAPVQLTSGVYTAQGGLSPDGELLAYGAMEDPATRQMHLYVMLVSGGPALQLTSGDVQDSEPDWSHDGRRIVFASRRSGMPSLWLLDVDPSALKARLAAVQPKT